MSQLYVVKRGDTLSHIASRHGFRDWRKIWETSENTALRERRRKPELIQAGDEVAIPGKQVKKEKVTGFGQARFQLAAPAPLPAFALTLEDRTAAPLKGLDVELRLPGAGSTRTVVTDDHGVVSLTDQALGEGEVEVVSITDRRGDPKISFRDFLPQPLRVGTSHQLVLPNKRRVADAVASAAGVRRRATWGAAKPRKELDPDWDFDTVVIHHSGDGGEKSPREIQAKHFQAGYDDIAYEYVVTLEGVILEGRYIAFKSAGNSEHNTKKLAIIVAGDFEHQWWDSDDDPTPAAIEAVVRLVNVLKLHFPLTKLVGHRDLPRAKGPTKCPGGELYKLLGDVRRRTGLAGP